MSQMLPQLMRQVGVFASALPMAELGGDTKHSWFLEQLRPRLCWFVSAPPV